MKLLPPTFEPWEPTDDRSVAVMMSGGVDSTLTTSLLKKQGWKVLGVTMKIPVIESCCSGPQPCCGADAALMAADIGIPHYYVDVEDMFNEQVVDRFRSSYTRGRTPNPCVDCNTFLKFSALWDLIDDEFGIRHVATGHYARVLHENGESFLARGADPKRDQSYFIYGVPRRRLSGLVLPLGDYDKDETRKMAAEAGLKVADKPDSMELCFAGEGDYRNALDSSCCSTGFIQDLKGNVLGTHKGVCHYTIGQRRGLGIAGGEPLYVVKIDAATDTVYVGTREEALEKQVHADTLNILIPELLKKGSRLTGKIRSYSPMKPCEIVEVGDDEVTVEFATPQFGPAPGQSLVLYDDRGRVVAGGEITNSGPE